MLLFKAVYLSSPRLLNNNSQKGRKQLSKDGEWMKLMLNQKCTEYLYIAVDQEGNAVNFHLTKRRQRISAQSFTN